MASRATVRLVMLPYESHGYRSRARTSYTPVGNAGVDGSVREEPALNHRRRTRSHDRRLPGRLQMLQMLASRVVRTAQAAFRSLPTRWRGSLGACRDRRRGDPGHAPGEFGLLEIGEDGTRFPPHRSMLSSRRSGRCRCRNFADPMDGAGPLLVEQPSVPCYPSRVAGHARGGSAGRPRCCSAPLASCEGTRPPARHVDSGRRRAWWPSAAEERGCRSRLTWKPESISTSKYCGLRWKATLAHPGAAPGGSVPGMDRPFAYFPGAWCRLRRYRPSSAPTSRSRAPVTTSSLNTRVAVTSPPLYSRTTTSFVLAGSVDEPMRRGYLSRDRVTVTGGRGHKIFFCCCPGGSPGAQTRHLPGGGR